MLIETTPETILRSVLAKNNVFIHGQAGTGKSTLIKDIMALYGEETLLLAPTGLAAMNIDGCTINSLFQQPLDVIYHKKELKTNSDLRGLIRNGPIRRIVIDEAGMMTSSLIHFIDVVLRKTTRKMDLPFGGVQVIMLGDLLQLGCIVKREARKDYFKRYGFPEFFHYPDWNKLGMVSFNLTKVYRQTDPVFTGFLQRMREGSLTPQDFDYINQRVGVNNSAPVICTTNANAERINQSRMAMINEMSKTYRATVTGRYKERPVPEKIELKVGARVVICANKSKQSEDYEDHPYVNGDTGVILSLQQTSVTVDTDRIGPVVVKVFNYSDKKPVVNDEGEVERVVVGTYSQIPVKVFYASTVHKSQGQTLDAAHVDLERRVFAEGAPYVAFSRVRNINNLTLERPLRYNDILVNKRCLDFIKTGHVQRLDKIVDLEVR